MAKKSSLNRGPFTAKDIEQALRLAGWEGKAGAKHFAYRHPDKPDKIMVSRKWTGVRAGDPIFNGICEKLGVTKEEFLRLLAGEKL